MPEKQEFTTQQAIEIVESFEKRYLYQNIKRGSKTYFEEQASFIAGAMAMAYALDIVPHAGLSLCVMSGRDIIKEFLNK